MRSSSTIVATRLLEDARIIIRERARGGLCAAIVISIAALWFLLGSPASRDFEGQTLCLEYVLAAPLPWRSDSGL